ncbi:MAG: L-serine ammonia-lyase, iron-sulfur-dependent, subunit alpha, partial [Megasphaera sp.]|nr:L-serine ammonia-lyase, iron-sulfur-dependent, subunit alpha [Megasphaera sp.]
MYKYEYNSLHDLLSLAEKEQTTLSDIVVRHEVESSEVVEEKVRAMMDSRLDVFQESLDAGMSDPGKSVSGLVGGDAHKLAESTPTLLGPLAHKAAIYALAVSEANAKMFKIVACPTAGSCGIVPAVMMAAAETLDVSREAMVNALFIASGIGAVVSHNATVAGADT